MTTFDHVFDLHKQALKQNHNFTQKRDLFHRLSKKTGTHFNGIVGARGVGKSVLLRQLAAKHKESLYISLDTLGHESLFDLVKQLKEFYNISTFFLDEIHFMRDIDAQLKNIYDFLDVNIVFTSSVTRAMQLSAHDLSRRVVMHDLYPFSFREYLRIRHGETHQPLSLNEIIQDDIPPAYFQLGSKFGHYLNGGLLPFSLNEADPLPLLKNILERIIHLDTPQTHSLKIEELQHLRRLLQFVGESFVDGINYSTLSSNLGITKYKAEQYVYLLEKAFVLVSCEPSGKNVSKEKKILMQPPFRPLYQPIEAAIGGLREDYVAMALKNAGVRFSFLKSTKGKKTPDYLIQQHGQKIVIEVGGKGKGRSQFKGIQADKKIILGPTRDPKKGMLPLYLLGMLEPNKP